MMKEKAGLPKRNEGKLFNFRPLLFGAILMSLGVVFCFHYSFNNLSIAWLLCLFPLIAALLFLCFSFGDIVKIAVAFLALCACFFIGFFGFLAQVHRFDADVEGEYYFSGRVVEIRENAYNTAVVLDDLYVDGERCKDKLIAYMPTSFCEDIVLSDQVFLHGDIQKHEIETENFSLFAKDLGKGVSLAAYAPEGYKTGHTFHLFLDVNTKVKNTIDSGMDEGPAAVTKAVLLGDTSGIEADLYENIRRGGIAHIFAVSGLHVGSLFGFCVLLTKKTALRRLPLWLQFFLTAFVLVVYAGICAFTASVLRATVICLVAYAGRLLQIKTDFLQSLGLSASVILLFDPAALFTVGFQLSFAACFGIAFLSKPIGQVFDETAKLYRKAFPRKLTKAEIDAIKNDDTLPPRLSTRAYRAIASFLATSLGAQIFTAPLLLQYFGYVSGWALLLNCIFVPFISAVFSILLWVVLIACVLPVDFAVVILYLPNVIWSTVLLLFEAVDFTSFCIEGLKITSAATVLYIAATLFFTDKWNMKKSYRLFCGIGFILVFGIAMVALNV